MENSLNEFINPEKKFTTNKLLTKTWLSNTKKKMVQIKNVHHTLFYLFKSSYQINIPSINTKKRKSNTIQVGTKEFASVF